MKSLKCYHICSIIFTFIVGTVLHFTYAWSNNNSIVGIFSSVNESTWEHLKILFFPMLLTTIFGYIKFGKRFSNFLCSKTIGIISAMLFIVIFFYTYTGILGKSISFIDISLFYFSAILGDVMAYFLIVNKNNCNNKKAVLILAMLVICFIVFTFFPLNIALFQKPIT